MGAAEGVAFLASIGAGATRREQLQTAYDALHERSSRLATQLLEGLRAIGRVRIYGPDVEASRTPTVAFTVAGRPSVEVARGLAG